MVCEILPNIKFEVRVSVAPLGLGCCWIRVLGDESPGYDLPPRWGSILFRQPSPGGAKDYSQGVL